MSPNEVAFYVLTERRRSVPDTIPGINRRTDRAMRALLRTRCTVASWALLARHKHYLQSHDARFRRRSAFPQSFALARHRVLKIPA